jgi:hypothetical protein
LSIEIYASTSVPRVFILLQPPMWGYTWCNTQEATCACGSYWRLKIKDFGNQIVYQENKRMRAYKAAQSPSLRHRILKFSKSEQKYSIVKNELSVI